jgi:hypothetical protein
MDPAQGQTEGKSLTSKLKAKVRGVKKVKNHLPGRHRRDTENPQRDVAVHDDDDDSSGSSSDESPRKPGPETGYNVGQSTPFTTVKTTSLKPDHSAKPQDRRSPPRSHNRDYESKLSNDNSGYRASDGPPSSMAPSLEEKFQYMDVGDQSRPVNYPNDRSYQIGQSCPTTATEGVPKIGHSEHENEHDTKPPGLLARVQDSVGGVAAAVGSQLGYYNEVDATPHEQPSTDPNAPSVLDKAKHTLGLEAPSDPNSPTVMEKAKHTLGMDKPSDPNAPTVMEKTKALLGMGKPGDRDAQTKM